MLVVCYLTDEFESDMVVLLRLITSQVGLDVGSCGRNFFSTHIGEAVCNNAAGQSAILLVPNGHTAGCAECAKSAACTQLLALR